MSFWYGIATSVAPTTGISTAPPFYCIPSVQVGLGGVVIPGFLSSEHAITEQPPPILVLIQPVSSSHHGTVFSHGWKYRRAMRAHGLAKTSRGPSVTTIQPNQGAKLAHLAVRLTQPPIPTSSPCWVETTISYWCQPPPPFRSPDRPTRAPPPSDDRE